MKKALITGITGQDGAYLTELLLEKGYEVHGIKRRASMFNTHRIDHLYQEQHIKDRRLILHYGDMTDASNLIKIVQRVRPDEVYNLAAQSHVAVSFESPEYTADTDALGTLRLLEAVKTCGLHTRCRFYQASTSELYGRVAQTPQTESTPFHPRSPYAVAKIYAFWIVVNYREAFGMYACNGILFNHESPLRGETFVTRKITRALARIRMGTKDCLYLGNLDAKRDWGHAKDYVKMQWLMLQQEAPDDYVIATGTQHSVREFVEIAAGRLGIELAWEGEGIDETGVVTAVHPVPDRKMPPLPASDQALSGAGGPSSGSVPADTATGKTPSGKVPVDTVPADTVPADTVPADTVPADTVPADTAAGRTPSAPAPVRPGDVIVRVDPMYFRPAEVDSLLGDPSKARQDLGWAPRISFGDMVAEMVDYDLEEARRDALCQEQGFATCNFFE